MPKKPSLKIHVVLDTNAVFTDAPEQLLNNETREFLAEIAQSSDPETTVYLPDVVRLERRHQMSQRARKLLPGLAKLEALLGHKLGISEEIVDQRVEKSTLDQLAAAGLVELGVDESKIDLKNLILRSVTRQAPFDPGEKEKGFRDAIILETFYQKVENLPTSSQVCRIFFLVTNDPRMREAAELHLRDRLNVKVLDSLSGLRTILNALKSEITDAVLKEILPRAAELFYKANDEKSLYFIAIDKIAEEHAAPIFAPPFEGARVATNVHQESGPKNLLSKQDYGESRGH